MPTSDRLLRLGFHFIYRISTVLLYRIRAATGLASTAWWFFGGSVRPEVGGRVLIAPAPQQLLPQSACGVRLNPTAVCATPRRSTRLPGMCKVRREVRQSPMKSRPSRRPKAKDRKARATGPGCGSCCAAALLGAGSKALSQSVFPRRPSPAGGSVCPPPPPPLPPGYIVDYRGKYSHQRGGPHLKREPT
jgi:hypothetical protein